MAGHKQAQQLAFLFGQCGDGAHEVLARAVGEPGSSGAGVKEKVASGGAFDGGKHFKSFGISDDAAAGTCLDRVQHFVLGAKRCKDDALQFGHPRPQVPTQVKPVAVREPVVEQRHIRVTGFDLGQRFVDAGGSSDNLQLGVAMDQLMQPWRTTASSSTRNTRNTRGTKRASPLSLGRTGAC
jgi:hypothetical protein